MGSLSWRAWWMVGSALSYRFLERRNEKLISVVIIHVDVVIYCRENVFRNAKSAMGFGSLLILSDTSVISIECNLNLSGTAFKFQNKMVKVKNSKIPPSCMR